MDLGILSGLRRRWDDAVTEPDRARPLRGDRAPQFEIVAGDDQRRREPHDRGHASPSTARPSPPAARTPRARAGELADRSRRRPKGRGRAPPSRRGCGSRARALQHMGAELAAALHQALFAEHVQRFEPDRGPPAGLPPKSRAVRAGREHVPSAHGCRRRPDNREHTAAPAALPRMSPSGADMLVLECEPGAGAPRGRTAPRQESAARRMLVAERAQFRAR